ncbi:head-to-tail stopper [Gordonia phage Nina]|uniref:Head-to-tail stopper n=1 Tax=Gordonia phage Nina TaxID=2499026 RepID=A0A3S9UN33_9CAUD|nr:head-to-tail stopper [Gordonia phage Nina]
MRALYPIGYEAYTGEGEDGYGNTVDSWAPSVQRKIYGANSPESSEDLSQGPNRVVITRVLLIPKNSTWTPRDRVTLPDEPGFMYEVEGVAGDARRNPYRWNPGGTITVRRVDG